MNKLLLPFLLLCAASINAQSLPETRTQETYVMTDKGIVGKLELDTAQRRQLELVERTYEQDLDALLDNDTLSDAAAKAEADQLARVRHAQFKRVLTAEQYEKWVRMLADAEVP